MSFLAEAITGDLILIPRPAPDPGPRRAIVARSVKPADAALVRLLLWLAALFAPTIAPLPGLWSANKARLAVLAIVGLAIVEVAAQAQLTKALGGVIA